MFCRLFDRSVIPLISRFEIRIDSFIPVAVLKIKSVVPSWEFRAFVFSVAFSAFPSSDSHISLFLVSWLPGLFRLLVQL